MNGLDTDNRHGFRVICYGVAKHYPVDPVTRTASRCFTDLAKAIAWGTETTAPTTPPGQRPCFGIHAWNPAAQSLWAIEWNADLTWRFMAA